jgi:hypothetical protein
MFGSPCSKHRTGHEHGHGHGSLRESESQSKPTTSLAWYCTHVPCHHAMLSPPIHAPRCFFFCSRTEKLRTRLQEALYVTHDRRRRTLPTLFCWIIQPVPLLVQHSRTLSGDPDASLATLEAAECRWLLTEPSVSIMDCRLPLVSVSPPRCCCLLAQQHGTVRIVQQGTTVAAVTPHASPFPPCFLLTPPKLL